MTDWQIGDLAMLIAEPKPDSKLKRGCAYTVEAITPYRLWNNGEFGVGLILVGFRHKTNANGNYWSGLFTKILPDKHEQCEPEFVALLKRSKRKATA